jgi:hypothetical protein
MQAGDGKGVVMRRGPDDPKPKAHRGKGDKANKKRMAIVGAIYSVDRHVRTPEEVVAALFRDPRAGDVPVKRPEPTAEASAFARERLLRVLRGEVKSVGTGLRRLATVRGLTGAKRKRLRVICRYLKANAQRMRYDEYLEKGYPIASGVIEGACRHCVKDRMERSGMRWCKAGAQALPDVRSEYLNGDWEGFLMFRIDRETQRLYPHREVLEEIPWALAV